MRQRGLAWVACLLGACGGAPAPAPAEPLVAAEPAPAPASVADGTISRPILHAVLDAGLGRFLQGVEVEPHIVGGRFVGYRLKRFFPDDPSLTEVDLRPGDVVRRVNGLPIERPEQAQRVWEGLRVASELWVEYERAGAARELRFAIVDRPTVAAIPP